MTEPSKTGEWLSGPLRMAMILSAEGKHEAAARMFERHKRELEERQAPEERSDDDG